MKFKKIIAILISVIVSIILLLPFCYFGYLCIIDVTIRSRFLIFIISLLILFLPLFLSIKNLLSLLRNEIKPLKSIITEILLIPFTIFYYFFAIFLISATVATIPLKNYRQYKYLYRSNKDSDLIKYFPSDIPKDADDIKFYFTPSFLQSMTVMNLYYKASDDTVNEYKQKYEKLKLQSDEIKINALQVLYLGDNIMIDSEYKQYFLYSHSDNSEYGNHGGYSLVAINDKTNECIFAFYEW